MVLYQVIKKKAKHDEELKEHQGKIEAWRI
jgi:hypothetical protein